MCVCVCVRVCVCTQNKSTVKGLCVCVCVCGGGGVCICVGSLIVSRLQDLVNRSPGTRKQSLEMWEGKTAAVNQSSLRSCESFLIPLTSLL